MNVVAIIPARGGSKRIPHKNIAALGGKPLLLYTLDCAREAGLLAATIVSTEDERIASVARDAGARVMHRPAALATDVASTEGVLLDVLDRLAGEGVCPGWVMTLPPTSPMRTPETLQKFAKLVESGGEDIDCFMSVTENRGDFWLYENDGTFRRLFPDAPRRQQDRAPLFEENSAVYLTRVAALRGTGSILGRRVIGIPITPLEGMDINTPEDLSLAEAMLRRSVPER